MVNNVPIQMSYYQKIYSGLLISAFLGGAMFSFGASIVSASMEDWRSTEYYVRVLLGFWILLYFIVPWILIQNKKNHYGLYIFLVDTIDLIVIVVSIVFLGFVSSKVEPNLAVVYPSIAAIPLLSWWGNSICPRTSRGPRWHVSIVVFAVGVGIPLLGLQNSLTVNFISIAILYITLAFYYSRIKKELKNA